MAKKRRVFEIDLPDDTTAEATETFPAGKGKERRGPMASAISEAADSGRERQALEASIRAENDALAHEYVRLKKLGLVVGMVPLDQIETYKLTRDRAKGDDPELAELTASIQAIGLSNPVQLEAREDGRYELIQGYRRLSAYRALLAETSDKDLYGAIPAVVTEPGDSLAGLYRRMVDENLVRKDISFAEMAQLALDYAADSGTSENDPDKAVAVLYKSAGYQKRSYIRAFTRLMGALGKDLHFAPDIPRSLGLALVARLEKVDGLPGLIRQELKGWDNRSAQDELEVLRRHAQIGSGDLDDSAPKPTAKAPKPAKAKTSFQFDRREGRGKCVAAAGKLEIQLDCDFTTIDRRKLEQAVALMLDQLEG